MGGLSVFMQLSFPISVLVGSILGFLSGLGTGGGSLLILWLTLVLHLPQDSARLINLMFFIPSAFIACIFRRKQGHLNLKKILPAIMAGSISAGICGMIVNHIDTSLLQKPFGILLLFTGIRELMYRPKEN